MKFIIKSDAFTKLDDDNCMTTIPLKTTATKRNLFLKKEAGKLLDIVDREVDFDELTSGMPAEQIRDMEDGLTLLECFGIAECSGRKRDEFKSIRIAGERDYRGIAAFLKENINDDFGFINDWNNENYSEDNIRARQFNNMEYTVISLKDGKINGILILAPQAKDSYSNSVVICGCLLESGLKDAEKEEILKGLINEGTELFKNEAGRLRFLKSSEKQTKVLNVLEKTGFKEICTLKHETLDGRDVTVYDHAI